jgi:magnesium-transporting ATPase (P-type)
VVLTVVQLLLINLAMDTLAAIAYGSEPALKEYMKDRPVRRDESIVTKPMFAEILISAAYITFIAIGMLSIQPIASLLGIDLKEALVDGSRDNRLIESAVFATFMMAITFNGFNARTSHIIPFENIGRNRNFLLVMGAIFLMQFVFVTFGGEALRVRPLSAREWLVCLALAFMVIPIDIVRKLITGAVKKD